MLSIESNNRRKISKAVYLLLQRYHRTHGLRVEPWNKQPGNHYFSFFCDAVRHPDAEPQHLAEIDGSYCLTVYQDHIGIPAWANGGNQMEHPDSRLRELRASELVDWYEAHLSLDAFLRDHEGAIRPWRRTYHVDESERYLLTWNVLGLYSSLRAATCFGWGCCECWSRRQGEAGLEAFPTARPRESLMYCEGLVFCTDGRILTPDGGVIDLWERRLRGEDAMVLAKELAADAGEA